MVALIKLQEEILMINLTNTCVLVRTPEENKKLLEEAEKQGFTWFSMDNCKPLSKQYFPDILKFCNDKSVVHSARIEAKDSTFYEASKLLETKEMTAREFIEWYVNVNSLCSDHTCAECLLSGKYTKCNSSLCNSCNWKGNVDELLKIAVSGRITVLTPEKKAVSTLENYIENPDREALNDEFVDALKLAVEKLKEVK